MTIKTDRAVCLILPKSLVCIQEPTQDFFGWGWLGGEEQKPMERAQVKGMDLYGHVERCLEIQGRKCSQASKGQEF